MALRLEIVGEARDAKMGVPYESKQEAPVARKEGTTSKFEEVQA